MTIHLCFHGVGRCTQEREAGEAGYWMAEDTFRRVLDELPNHPDVEVSFDDGNRSDADVALPALRERGLSATFFALAGRLDDPASLSPADLKELRKAGMSIGSHGWAHVPWRGLSAGDVQRELVGAREALERAGGATITKAALPLGRYDRTLLGRLKRAGYETVYTSDRYPTRSSAWLQARYSVTSDDTVESVRAVLRHRVGMQDARNLAASLVKRLR